jgi:Xaa-Pro dipeptidase
MIGGSGADFGRLRRDLTAIQASLQQAGLDGWLLFDVYGRNPVSARMLGLEAMTRRYFVLIPARGEPVALTHGIEQAPWAAWPWGKQSYVAWRELDEQLRALLAGSSRVAMEYVAADAVPALDLVPAGIVELVRRCGCDVVASGDLVTRFYAAWSAQDLASHRRASAVLARVADAAFRRLADTLASGAGATEGDLRDWVLADCARQGVRVGVDCIPAIGPNAANPHYVPDGPGAAFRRGDVVLLDLWGKETEASVYSDQTWMAYLGEQVPERVAALFAAIRDARDAAVTFVREAWSAHRPVQGYEVDDVCRGVVQARGWAEYFIHRTGHSIDQADHGMGPNIDNLETHETRLLLPGIAFSIEPGIYIPGDVGLRTEIDVYMGEDGPEVTTPDPQDAVLALYTG